MFSSSFNKNGFNSSFNSNRNLFNNNHSDKLFFIVFSLIVFSIVSVILYGIFNGSNTNSQLLKIIMTNTMFWINFVFIFAIAIFLKIVKNTNYSIKELFIQNGVTLFVLTIAYFTIFTTTTDLKQTEYWNGQVKSVTYEEKWTEEYDCSYTECTGSGKNEKCRTVQKTCYTNHPDYYYLTSTNDTQITLYEHNWKTFEKEFGSKEIKMNRSSQTYGSKMRGEGDIWCVYPNKNIPVVEEHSYINYIVASKRTIHKNFQKELSEDDKNSIYEYPKLFENKYGKIQVDRVLGKQNIKSNISSEYETYINELNALIGKTKEVNIFLYLVKDKDRKLVDTIENKFKYNKNDAIIILNLDNNGLITWSDSVNFLSGEKFTINARSQFNNMNINDYKTVSIAIGNLINQQWERVEMKNFEYLLGDIDIDFKWELIVILINLVLNIFLFKYFLNSKEY